MMNYAPESPAFKDTTQITEPTDLAHADNINHAPKDAFDNTVALKLMSLGAVEEYDPEAAHAVGDYCMNSGKLYKCNTAIESPGEAWTAAHWDETDVLSEIKDIADELGLGTGGGSSGSGVSLSGGKVTITDSAGQKTEVNPNGSIVFTDAEGGATSVSISDLKSIIDWVNNTGKGIPATVTAAQKAASNAQSTASTANNTANTVNTWKNKYNTLMMKLAGEA